MKKKTLFGDSGLWQQWKDHRLLRSVLFLFLGLILYGFMIGNVVPETVDVSIGARAEQDIISPSGTIDERATQQEREEAADNVEPVFTQDHRITDAQLEELNHVFNQMVDIVDDDELDDEEKQELLQEKIPFEFSEESYAVLVEQAPEQIETMQVVTSDIVSRIMHEGVRERNNELEEARNEVEDSLVFSTLDGDLRAVSREIARESIVPNTFYDAEQTQALQDEARERVDAVEIREGEVLVEAGQQITQADYERLLDLGLLSDSVNWFPFLGLALLVLLILAFIGIYVSTSDMPIQTNNTQFLIFVLIFALTVVVMKVVSIGQHLDYTGIAFVTPVAAGTMLMTSLLHQRLAIFSTILFAIIAAIIFNANTPGFYDFQYALVALFSGATGAFFLGPATRKTKILQAGFVVSLVTMLVVITTLLLRSALPGWFDVALYLLFAFLSGVLASILTMGLLPFFEAAFGILSSVKLVELSSPNQPLLRKLLIDAPGTYHHSVMVANLAEAATEAVGGNGLLARVGAYYHDLGKTKRPHFFVENQMNMENPHDKIAPQLSATIIVAHARDGKQMLKEKGFPKAIQDIAEQHHGTTLIKYFYHRAQQETDSHVNESDFRYPGPKAQFKESAIVGIADSVEAAVRSLSKVSPERIEHLVRTIIRERLDDGQFDECDLTLRELDLIAQSMCETLKGTFHSRIEYPDEFKKDKAGKESRKWAQETRKTQDGKEKSAKKTQPEQKDAEHKKRDASKYKDKKGGSP